jgi:ElaB/YqjD/DUF883 family membrane-anchored ribosome-binding protein
MFGHNTFSGARSAQFREIDRRLQSLERNLEHTGTRAASRASGTADQLTEIVSAVLAGLTERFRGLPSGDDALKFGGDAAKLGTDALRRVSKEVEHRLSKEVEQRPLVTLAVAVGIGILAGMVILRR